MGNIAGFPTFPFALKVRRWEKVSSHSKLVFIAPFPFGNTNFLVPCISEYLSIEDNLAFSQTCTDVRFFYNNIWKRKARILGLLPVNSNRDGKRSCIEYFKISNNKTRYKDLYKVAASKQYLLTIEEMLP